MKFTCERSGLLQAINIASKAIAAKPSTPILGGIYIKAENDTVEFHATDNETSIITKITSADGLVIEKNGSAVLIGRYLQEVIRNIAGENVTFEHKNDENTMLIKSGNMKYSLLTMSSEDYPVIKEFQSDMNFKLSDKLLRNLIVKTQYACSNDPARPIFTGCALNISENAISMAATNTHQLALQTSVLNTNYDGNMTITIPSKVLSAFEKMLVSEVPSDVLVTLTSKQLSFSYDEGKIYIAIRLIEGKFPDYNKVIPLDFKTRVTIDTDVFTAALRRINVIASTLEYKSCKFEFTNSSIKMSANNPDIGYSEEIIPAVIDGDDIVISFNSEYLTKVMGVISTDKFTFSLNTPLSAAAIREMESADFTYIITPIRTV